jgi:hemerythrin
MPSKRAVVQSVVEPSVPRVTWTPDLALGVGQLDTQHKELFDQIDRVVSAIAGGEPDQAVGRLIRFLETYVDIHFGSEEKLMVRAGYPAYPAHQAEHQRFMQNFERIKTRFASEGSSSDLAKAVSTRVCDWLVAHVRLADRAFAAFLKTSGAKADASVSSQTMGAAPDRGAVLAWTDDLSVGVEAIDEQHKEIFRRVNKLMSAARGGAGRVEVGATLEFLSEYVIEHFTAEESLMRDAAYPERGAHHAQHEAFKKDAAKLKAAFDGSGATVSLVIDANRRLCDWLTNHIRKSDRALAAYLLRNRDAGR